MAETYQHAEAFCLMVYENGEERETLWNSRDGVTPFVILSRTSGNELVHKHWKLDRFMPYFKPPVGSRIFVDLTKEKHLEYQRSIVEKCWNNHRYPMKDNDVLGPLGKDGAARLLAEEDWQDGAPDIVIVA